MESLDYFGANLRDYRKSQGLTQTELAKRLDVGSVYLSQLEAGSRAPSAGMMVAVAAALGCTVTDLLAPPKKGKP